MKKDIRDSALYQEAEALIRQARRPGTGQINDAGEIHLGADGQQAVFAGVIVDKLEEGLTSRVCHIDLSTADTRVLTFGPNTDRSPKYSPDGRQIAFLSDRHAAGEFQLYLLDPASGAARPTPWVEGWVEYLQWSPDGTQILLGVAGHGADISGAQGAVTSKQMAEPAASWMPVVEIGDDHCRWRHVWVYELAADSVRQVSKAGTNVWEANWCGNDRIAAVTSPGSEEGLWYSASLHLIEVRTGNGRELYTPRDQLGWPAASASGTHLAIVEAVCSDRWVVAGDVLLIDTASGKSERIDTHGADITCIEWRSETRVLLAGHRGFETVVGVYDVSARKFTQSWSSKGITTGMSGAMYAKVAGLSDSGDCVLVGETFSRAPEIAAIRGGEYSAVKSFGSGITDPSRKAPSAEAVSWKAPDGLEIQGWLFRPIGKGPFPLVMIVHGGPVFHYRPTWSGRGSPGARMMLDRGYALFMPNPRGSSGRGQDFARHVVGDMGGADTQDYLSGLDHLVEQGIADPKRLGVMGLSYGGFMTAWLITQDSRFAAAVPAAPVINMVTQHLISNIPHFVKLFLADSYTNPTGKYFERSPVMHAHKVKTPTLNICGALDRCTPPEEAMQFHNALLENGVKSVLLTYPGEGHGIRKFPALADYAARVVGWFEQHFSREGAQG